MFSGLQLGFHLGGAAIWLAAETYQYVADQRPHRAVAITGWCGFALTVASGMLGAFSPEASRLDLSQQLVLLAKIMLAAASAIAGVLGLVASRRGLRQSGFAASIGLAVGAAALGWLLAG